MAISRANTGAFKSEYAARKKKRGMSGHESMLIKLGTCAAAFIVVLAIAAQQNADSVPVYGATAGIDVEADEGEQTDDSLGKLKFVELPGLIEVFGADGGYRLGFDYTHTSTVNAGSVLCVFGGAYMQPIPAPDEGKVKNITYEADAYYTVSLSMADDRELVYSGLTAISIEEGQTLLPGDTLGTCGGYAITIQAYESGRPVEPAKLFGLTGNM